MKEYFDVKLIKKNGDVILSKKNFDEFVNDNNLVKFRKKVEYERFIYRKFFTVFHGVKFFSETEEETKK